jgi:hypothetical protein
MVSSRDTCHLISTTYAESSENLVKRDNPRIFSSFLRIMFRWFEASLLAARFLGKIIGQPDSEELVPARVTRRPTRTRLLLTHLSNQGTRLKWSRSASC